ncbi:MAG: hypothetical protein DRN66_01030 [Candidatus Nanohalarchaeota archaeon]|nr:MAG: hypothetical protein DRN66_01030 [Candidatus Nanohaloarchaeota archaeon]
MYNIATFGSDKFTLGFNLCGIKESFVVSGRDEANKTAKELLSNKEIGLVIIEAEVFNNLKADIKDKTLTTVSPIFVVLKEKDQKDDSLRLMIKKAIGIDLLNEEEKER